MTQISQSNMTNVDYVKIKGIQHKSLIRPFPSHKIQQKYDYMLKIIIVGDSGVGKTNIISAFCNTDYQFTATHVPTIGVDFSAKIIQLQNKKIKLQVWDTAGQQRFRTITQTYYKGAAGIFLVYSVGNKESFNNVKKWMEQINQKTGENVKVVLIANKIDLPDQDKLTSMINKNQQENTQNSQSQNNGIYSQNINKHTPIRCAQETCRVVSKKQGWDLALQYGIRYHEVSAKMNEKVDEIFYNMAQMINSQLQQELNNTILQDDPSHTASYKINHSGTIELSTKGQKRTKYKSKKGIVYHKSGQVTGQSQMKEKTMRLCNC